MLEFVEIAELEYQDQNKNLTGVVYPLSKTMELTDAWGNCAGQISEDRDGHVSCTVHLTNQHGDRTTIDVETDQNLAYMDWKQRMEWFWAGLTNFHFDDQAPEGFFD